jgi:hypothetical protein
MTSLATPSVLPVISWQVMHAVGSGWDMQQSHSQRSATLASASVHGHDASWSQAGSDVSLEGVTLQSTRTCMLGRAAGCDRTAAIRNPALRDMPVGSLSGGSLVAANDAACCRERQELWRRRAEFSASLHTRCWSLCALQQRVGWDLQTSAAVVCARSGTILNTRNPTRAQRVFRCTRSCSQHQASREHQQSKRTCETRLGRRCAPRHLRSGIPYCCNNLYTSFRFLVRCKAGVSW